jgi:uncharacterized integral membrane protein (TIGR00698 family)
MSSANPALLSPAARLPAVAPGIALTATIAAAAFALRQIPGVSLLSPMILSIVIGMLLHNLLGTPARAKAGVAFTLRRVLRGAIVLLGLQLTAGQVVEVGGKGVAIIALSLIGCFSFTLWLGKLLGVERKLAELIAAGTSICGASAVIATNSVTQAHDEDVAYAVACVTVFGSIAMFLYPMLRGPLALSPHDYGLWSGASIHEIAQVVAAAFQGGREAGDFGTIAKLSRVMLLAPMVIALGLLRSGPGGKAPMPWFVLGFIALVACNSLFPLPAAIKGSVVTATGFLLSMALAAMGLETDIRKLRAKGLRPLALGFATSLFIACLSLVLIKLGG